MTNVSLLESRIRATAELLDALRKVQAPWNPGDPVNVVCDVLHKRLQSLCEELAKEVH